MTSLAKLPSWRSAEDLPQDKSQMFAKLGLPEFSADPSPFTGSSANADHAAPDTGSTRLKGIHRHARDIGLGVSQEIAKRSRLLVLPCENAIGNDGSEYAIRSQELARVQHVRSVIAPFKRRVQNDGIKPGL